MAAEVLDGKTDMTDLISWARNNLQGIEGVDDENYTRMISGQSFDPWKPNLVHARLRASEASVRLYKLKLEDFPGPLQFFQGRQKAAMDMLGKSSKGLTVEPFQVEYGFNISAGENFYANSDVKLLDSSLIRFGDDCDIGPGVTLCTERHVAELKGYDESDKSIIALPITIGNRVWMGANALVLGGVTVGDSTVIAAGAVVTEDVPSNVVYGGYPARVLRNIDN